MNVVPLSVSLTAKFYQTMQDFFFPKAGDSDQTDRDHGHLFAPSGIQREFTNTLEGLYLYCTLTNLVSMGCNSSQTVLIAYKV